LSTRPATIANTIGIVQVAFALIKPTAPPILRTA
jgi:hypothetical protein